jgi:hypothetical protein
MEQKKEESYDLRFPLARSMIVSGPSCSGKSTFVMQLLQDEDVYFTPPPRRLIWYFGEVQPSPALSHVEYRKGLPTPEEIDTFQHDVIVLDDLMWESRSSLAVGNLFTRVAHHRQCFIIHITQNLFQSGSVTRTQSLNAHYFVLFKNPRDRLQITYLARQIYPRCPDFITASFEEATTAQNHGYLLLDLGPTTPEKLRVRSGILLRDKQYTVYVPGDDVYPTPKIYPSGPGPEGAATAGAQCFSQRRGQ